MAHWLQRLADNASKVGLTLLLSMAATGSFASDLRPEAACPVYDLHLATLVEDHGTVEDTDPEVLRAATLQMIDARRACRDGDVKRALQIYDSINLDYVPMSPFYRVMMR